MNGMFKKTLVVLIGILIVYQQAWPQNGKRIPPEKPKLIIGIIVGQMRYDYLFRYWDKYSEGGFKRLINEGTFCRNVRYNYLFTQTSPGVATISTGAFPAIHGIISEQWYDRVKDVVVCAAYDERCKAMGGSFDYGRYSPARLLSSTIGDELRFINPASKVISISLDPEAAVFAGGHISTAAYWFDPVGGGWMSNSCFLDSLPGWVADFNAKKFADLYLSEIWNPLLPAEQYTESLPDKNPYEKGLQGQTGFPYDLNKMSFRKGDKRNYELLKCIPAGNMYTNDFAINAMLNDSLGKTNNTDMLYITYSVGDHAGNLYGTKSMEIEDVFLRLDKDLEHLLDFIDQQIGKENVLIYVTSDHGAAYVPKYLEDAGVPSGVFNQNQALALLSSYLNILYGKGEWIKFYKNQQLYLNQTLIEDSKLSLEQFQTTVANFLVQFTGVANAVTASNLQHTNFTNGILYKIQNDYNQKRSGDIILNLEPGWIEKSDNATDHNSSYSYDAHVPLIWYGWKIGRQTINNPLDPTCIAPTIASFLDILTPNGCSGSPIIEMLDNH